MQFRKTIILSLPWAVILLFPAFLFADTKPADLLAEGRVDDAISSLHKAVDSSPSDAASYNLLCRAYLMLGEWDAGVTACEKSVALAPDRSEYHLWLGRIYGEKADHSNFLSASHLAGKVRNEFETAVKLDPKSVDARADLADFYLEAPGIVGGGKDKAEAQAQEIAKLDPAQALRVRARIAEEKKDYATAENDYRAAITQSGGKAGTWLNLARFYRRLSRFDEMEDAIKHATAPDLHRPDVWMSAAEILINAQRNPAEATDLLKRYLSSGATVEDAPVFKAHYLLGNLLQASGDKQGAAAQYTSALSLARSYSPAQNALNHMKH